MKKSSINTFLKLIQISLGGEFHDFPSLDTAEWQELFILAHKQAIVGILSNIVETLPADKRPPREILLKWIVTAERLKHLNQHLNNTVPKVETLFKDNGFQGCILKGQGIAQLYPHPELRTPGDIDIWVCGRRKEIISFVKNKCNSSHAVYHHIDGLKMDSVNIETHFTPSYMSNPFANRKLQAWIADISSQQFEHRIKIGENSIHAPTLAFNRVFILHHIYRHFLYEGIGLRQMMDFYYVLKQGFTEIERDETINVYNNLNLLGFAGAAIYVLQEIFGLEENYHIVLPNDKYGKVLLSEILIGGNFGQAITRTKHTDSKFQRGWRILTRNWRFIQYAPSEVLWMPYFKIMNNLTYVKSYNKLSHKN